MQPTNNQTVKSTSTITNTEVINQQHTQLIDVSTKTDETIPASKVKQIEIEDTQPEPAIDKPSLESLFDIWLQPLQNTIDNLKDFYETKAEQLDDEYLVTASQKQINDALYQFVTKNVNAILELRTEIHQDWFRLYCTINIMGIYVEVAGNFGLAHVQLDRYRQRFVFIQNDFTDVLKLRCENILKLQGIKLAVWFFHKVLKKDPLGLILEKLNLAKQKDNIIYLSIHRWLKNNKKIMKTLRKVQINYGTLAPEQLLLKAQINFGDLFTTKNNENIISEADNPDNINDEKEEKAGDK